MRIELPYLPPISWFLCIREHAFVELEAMEHYQKGSWRNRCHIAGPNGLQRLSIPLRKGKHLQMPILEVEIAYDEPWQVLHWRSIQTAYGSAPFFAHYADKFRPFYERQYRFLFEFNLELLQCCLKCLKWNNQIVQSQAYLPPSTSLPNDFRNFLSPKRPAPPPFQIAPYPQVFQDRFGFLPDLSILDLLFVQGPSGFST